jgi:hypothetical protein
MKCGTRDAELQTVKNGLLTPILHPQSRHSLELLAAAHKCQPMRQRDRRDLQIIRADDGSLHFQPVPNISIMPRRLIIKGE